MKGLVPVSLIEKYRFPSERQPVRYAVTVAYLVVMVLVASLSTFGLRGSLEVELGSE